MVTLLYLAIERTGHTSLPYININKFATHAVGEYNLTYLYTADHYSSTLTEANI